MDDSTRWSCALPRTSSQTKRNGMTHCPAEESRNDPSTNSDFFFLSLGEGQLEPQYVNVDWQSEQRTNCLSICVRFWRSQMPKHPGHTYSNIQGTLSSSVFSRPSLNILNYLKTWVRCAINRFIWIFLFK